MKTRFKIYLAFLAVGIVLCVAANLLISNEVPPTSPFTPEDLRQFQQSLATTNKP